ncbi:MAG: VPS10 domain-containing protein [Candidatus Aminicenantales bacterium]
MRATKRKILNYRPFLILLGLWVFTSPYFLQAQTKASQAKVPPFDYELILRQMKLRNIGPANMGGRVVDIAVPENIPSTIYAAVGPSGLWKSEDAGFTWLPTFEKETTVSVGAVAVSKSHPDIVWVGTGEYTARNSVAPGDGVYKSEDSGKTWKKMGLEETRFTSRIVIDPVNPDVVYVATQGHLWGPNEERGVYKTIDGGKSWKKVLYINPDTGIADLAIDPSNSKILYAAAWEHRRLPYYFRSGGEGSALYKSTDGGETWKRLTQGLPSGVNGRIGIGVARSNPNVVYALIENKEGGLFRSEDKGETWVRACDKRTYDRINFRPFYYSRLTVDPNNELVVYVYSGSCYVSKDGGKTFETIFRGAHPDHHVVWVDPNNSQHIISGNDGGLDISWDGGRHSHAVQAAAWAEVYNVAYDMRDPYYVYVGLQDNGNWGGPSNSRDRAGILLHMWYPCGGGDGFYTQVDPEEWYVLYRNLQMGGIERHNLRTGESVRIRPEARLSEEPYRFNWNSPIFLSPHNRHVLYFGGNYLFKSTDGGNSWVKVSPDLTTNDPKKQQDSGGPITIDNTGAENHCTILTIAESPLQEGVIWVGTDDGLVWITRDGGKNWENVTKNIKGLGPDNNWVTRIEASHFNVGGAYLTVSRHQVDDFKPYLFKTEDFGKTWVSLRANLPEFGYLHVVREDPENKNLLFVGSEFGFFVSFDGGRNWLQYKESFPTVAVRDIKIHPRERDLIVGTHGRGVWIMDDIRPLEKLTPEKTKEPFILFDSKSALLFSYTSTTDMYSDPGFAGPNSPYGAGISYYLNPDIAAKAKIKLTILNKEGQTVATLNPTREPGLNRVFWNLREGIQATMTSQERAAEFSRGRGFGREASFGPYTLPGEYIARLEVDDQKAESSFLVKEDPLQGFPLEERKMHQKYFREAADLAQKGNNLLASLDRLSEQLNDLETRLRAAKETDAAINDKFKAIKEKVESLQEVYYRSPEEQSRYRMPLKVAYRGGTGAELVASLPGRIANYMGAPTQTTIDMINDLRSFLEPLLEKMKEVEEKDIPELNQVLAAKNFPYIKI